MSDRRVKHDRRRIVRLMSIERRRLADRRRQKRFKAKEGAFAALSDNKNRLGQINNISLVGLSFRYIESQEHLNPDSVLKIIVSGSGLFMDNLPYEPVSDFEIENEHAFSSVKMRQMHLAFGKLSPQQMSMLDYFILNHTKGEA